MTLTYILVCVSIIFASPSDSNMHNALYVVNKKKVNIQHNCVKYIYIESAAGGVMTEYELKYVCLGFKNFGL